MTAQEVQSEWRRSSCVTFEEKPVNQKSDLWPHHLSRRGGVPPEPKTVCRWLLGSPGAMMGSMRAAAVRLLQGRRQKLDAETAEAMQMRMMEYIILSFDVVMK